MKTSSVFIIFQILLLASLRLQASVPVQPEVPDISLKELLSMPEKNREVVAQTQKKPNLYPDLLKLAFNKEESFQLRWKALTLAASLRGERATVDILKACEASEWFMKNACLISLNRVNVSKAREQSQKLISDKALVVRSAAVQILAPDRSPKIRDLLWEEMEKPYNFRGQQSLWIRAEILDILAKAPTQQEYALFAKSLKDKDSRLHFYAVAALERLSNKKLGDKKATLAQKRELWLKTIK
jgi:hypothetical protein